MIIKPTYIIYEKHDAVMTLQEINTVMMLIVNEVVELQDLYPLFAESFERYCSMKQGNADIRVLRGMSILEAIPY